MGNQLTRRKGKDLPKQGKPCWWAHSIPGQGMNKQGLATHQGLSALWWMAGLVVKQSKHSKWSWSNQDEPRRKEEDGCGPKEACKEVFPSPLREYQFFIPNYVKTALKSARFTHTEGFSWAYRVWISSVGAIAGLPELYWHLRPLPAPLSSWVQSS